MPSAITRTRALRSSSSIASSIAPVDAEAAARARTGRSRQPRSGLTIGSDSVAWPCIAGHRAVGEHMYAG